MSDDEEVKFAVVRVKGKQKAVGLLNILLSNGYPDVSFVSNLDHLGFKSETLVEGSSSKVTSSSAVAPTTASAVSTTADPPRPSTPPQSSIASSDSKEQELKDEEPLIPSPQPANGNASSNEEQKAEASALEAKAQTPPSSDQKHLQPSTSSVPCGLLDQQPSVATPQKQQLQPQPQQQPSSGEQQVQQQKLQEQQPGPSNPVTLTPATTTNSLSNLASLAEQPYRLPVRLGHYPARNGHSTGAEYRSSMRSVFDAHLAAKGKLQEGSSSSSTTHARYPQKWNQQVSSTFLAQPLPQSPWLQKPQKVVDTGTKSTDERPIIFDPHKFTRARELAEEESRDTSYSRKDPAISSGSSTSAATVVGTPTVPTSMPSTSKSSHQSNQASSSSVHNTSPYLSAPQHQQQPPLIRRSVDPRSDLQGQPISRIPFSSPGVNIANHPQLYRLLQPGMPPNNPTGFASPMQSLHRLAHSSTGSTNLAPVPQLTPSQTKILSEALNYTLGQLNPELKEACIRHGITESQLVFFMSSRQHSVQASAAGNASTTVKEEQGGDSDDVEVLKVVPRKKRKNED